MAREDCTVTFQPDDKSIVVKKGERVLNAAIAAGVFINSVCGGKGACKRCKVKIDGVYTADESFLNDEEKKEGFVLACKTTIDGDVRVHIPESSRTGIHQLLTASREVALGKIAAGVKKIALTLPKPSLNDNISDVERIQRALLSEHAIDATIISLDLLRTLSELLRAHEWRVAVTLVPLHGCEQHEIISVERADAADSVYGLAVDIGTTTVVAQLIDLKSGAIVETRSDYNAQIVCGEDVIARISYEEENADGLQHLRNLIIQTINNLIKKITTAQKIRNQDIKKIVVSGNTIMTHLFLGMPTKRIKYEPYVPTANVFAPLKVKELGLLADPEAYVYSVPGRSAYVGGDVVSDIIASGMHKSDALCLLIDVGTNGEVVFGNREMLVSCSCSAGPAFEGGEVKHGMRADVGAIEEIVITDDCDVLYKTIGKSKPCGICGSGLIDLIAELFTNKIIDKAGKLQETCPRVRDNGDEKEFVVAYREEMVPAAAKEKGDLAITQSDINNIIRTKAAVYAGCSALLNSLDYECCHGVGTIFIAGGFGNYIDVTKAIAIGLLPDVPLEKFSFIGNGSLAGARAILLSEEKRKEAEDVYRMMAYLELSVNNTFFNEFTSALFLPHTDISQFPSVEKLMKNKK